MHGVSTTGVRFSVDYFLAQILARVCGLANVPMRTRAFYGF